MTVALLALAAAILVAPRRGRRATTAPTALRVRPPRRLLLAAAVVGVVGVAAVVPWTVVAASCVVAATAALRRKRAVDRGRRATESAALQGALDVLAGELRAGAHPVAAFETAAAETSAPVAASLRAVAARARLGVDVAGGLRTAAEHSAVPDHWMRLAVCWELAHRHGLPIASLMRTAHREFVERERFRSRVTAGMAGARATAAVLAGLPVLGIVLGQMIQADPIRILCSGGVGGVLLVVGTMLACLGLLWSDRITGRVTT